MDRRPFIFKLRNVKTAFAKHGILTDNEPFLFVLPADTTVLVLTSQKCGKNMIDNFVLSPDGQAGWIGNILRNFSALPAVTCMSSVNQTCSFLTTSLHVSCMREILFSSCIRINGKNPSLMIPHWTHSF